MLLGALQENLITVLVHDAQYAPIVRGAVDLSLFGGPYRILASRIYDYIDRFKKPPGDHLPDLFSDKLESINKREGQLYEDIIEAIYESKVNAEYVMSQLETFVKRQSLRSIAVDLNKALQRDTEESLEEAGNLLASANRDTLSVFDPGTRLSDKKRALQFLDIADSAMKTGVAELDRRGLGPTRKEMWLGVGDTKAGKTWLLIQLGKMALIQHSKVVHVSLEMSETRSAQRYLQALFAVAKRNDPLNVTKFIRDDLGRLIDTEERRVKPKLSLDDPRIRRKLEQVIDKHSIRLLDNIIIKEFPTGMLTVPQLVAYLNNLEAAEQFVPDLLIVDYPDLMKLDTSNLRLDIDRVYKELRGLAVRRNLALAIVSQSHRSASGTKLVKGSNVAEAYLKVAHCDVCVTYSQTDAERGLKLARLHVAAGRNDEDKFSVIISQQYATGTFVVDSAMMSGGYWDMIGRNKETEEA